MVYHAIHNHGNCWNYLLTLYYAQVNIFFHSYWTTFCLHLVYLRMGIWTNNKKLDQENESNRWRGHKRYVYEAYWKVCMQKEKQTNKQTIIEISLCEKSIQYGRWERACQIRYSFKFIIFCFSSIVNIFFSIIWQTILVELCVHE